MVTAAALAVLAAAVGMPADADLTGEAPIRFRGFAIGASVPGVQLGSTGVQAHDHPYSIVSPRGPLVVPGVLEASVLVGRTEAGRPGRARRQDSFAEAIAVTVFPESAQPIEIPLVRARASAVCGDGAVTTEAEGFAGDINVAGNVVPVPDPAPNTVLVDQGGLKIVVNEQTPIPNGVAVTSVRVTAGTTNVLVGRAEASVEVCPTDQAWRVGPPAHISLETGTGGSGEGTFTNSVQCGDQGTGSYFHFDYAGDLDPADASASSDAVAGTLDAFIDVHLSDQGGGGLAQGPVAYLLGAESRVRITTPRGAITAVLESGDCENPTLFKAGEVVAGSGTWELAPEFATGSFREATGQGTFSLVATVGPGADNTLTLTSFEGDISVLLPHLTFDTRGARSTTQGFLAGRVSAVLDVVNDGPGDAFDVTIGSITPVSPSITFDAPSLPRELSDLAFGEGAPSTLRFTLGPFSCDRLGCVFQYRVGVDALTALNQPIHTTSIESVVAPGVPS